MNCFVYAVSSIDKKYIYVGLTSNIEERLKRHNLGYERTTKPYKPFILLYSEACDDRISARKKEKYWKSGIGKEKLKLIREQIVSQT